ncbi:DUF6896 domain-containing protein [Myroides odoratus]|uniref:DUF6896 domain-containing protein n=1 Tax=Myroides odoratus TaxID=256 RepID=UPI0039B09AD2
MLESIEKVLHINHLDQIPSDSYIENLSRNINLIMEFAANIEPERQRVGEALKVKFPHHAVGVYWNEPKIGIQKLITDEEIDLNQTVLEQYALDYRELATKLIYGLSEQLNIDLNKEVPYIAFLNYWQTKGQSGRYKEWKFFFHGLHGHFYNTKTKQEIEVPIAFGLEFGALDPYFFSKYIKSTPQYYPLPVDIYDDYSEGWRIIERLTTKGIFEKINSTVPQLLGTVPKNRANKVPVETVEDIRHVIKPKPKFNLLKFLKLKK